MEKRQHLGVIPSTHWGRLNLKPIISIAIPVYNREKLLARALDSVLAQTFESFECVISDNHSTDQTLQVAYEYSHRDSRIRVFENSENIGPVNNWIKAVKACQSDYVKILFSDDWLDPDCLAQAVAAFESSPDIGFVYFNALLEGDTPMPPLRGGGMESGFSFLWRSLVSHKDVPVSPTAAAFRRSDMLSALLEPVKVPIQFDYMQTGAGPDQAIYLYAADKYSIVYYINQVLAHYGSNTCSITVETNRKQPGYLMKGYLFAQLAFLKYPSKRNKILTMVVKAGVYFHIANLFIKCRIKDLIRRFM